MLRDAAQFAPAVVLAAQSPASAPVARRPRRSRRLANEPPSMVRAESTDAPLAPPAIVSGRDMGVVPSDDAAALAEEETLRLAIERSLLASSAHPAASAANNTALTSEPPAVAAAEVVDTRTNKEIALEPDSENDYQAVNRKRPARPKRAPAKKAIRAATKKLFVPKSRIFWTKDPRTGRRSFCSLSACVLAYHQRIGHDLLQQYLTWTPRLPQVRWCEAGD